MPVRLHIGQFFLELMNGWRHSLARGEDLGRYRSRDIDQVAGMLRADFVRLPVLRFLGLDPIRAYTRNSDFFRWAQAFCGKCQKQNDCSLLAADFKPMPVFDKYCANASIIRRQLARTFV